MCVGKYMSVYVCTCLCACVCVCVMNYLPFVVVNGSIQSSFFFTPLPQFRACVWWKFSKVSFLLNLQCETHINLIFENESSRVLKGGFSFTPLPQSRVRMCCKFSKVSSLLNFLCTINIKLIFENQLSGHIKGRLLFYSIAKILSVCQVEILNSQLPTEFTERNTNSPDFSE